MFVLVVLCFQNINTVRFCWLTLAVQHAVLPQRKRHNEVAMGLSFVAVALLVLGFMGMAQHPELTAF